MSEKNMENITIELNIMETRLKDVEKNLSSIDGKLTQVVEALLGNSLTKQGGVVEEINVLKRELSKMRSDMDSLEVKQRENELFKNRVLWTIGIIIMLALILQYLGNFYFHFKKM